MKCVAEEGDVVDVGTRQISLQGCIDVACRHTKHFRLVAINDGIERWVAGVEIRKRLGNCRIRGGGLYQLIYRRLKRTIAMAAAVFDHHAKAAR